MVRRLADEYLRTLSVHGRGPRDAQDAGLADFDRRPGVGPGPDPGPCRSDADPVPIPGNGHSGAP